MTDRDTGRQNVESRQGVERAIEDRRRHQRRYGDRRFAVCIRLPRVHRRQPCLRAVAEKDQDERKPHHGVVEPGGAAGQHRPVQRAQASPWGPPGGRRNTVRIVPKRAIERPTPPIMAYFHAASSEVGRP